MSVKSFLKILCYAIGFLFLGLLLAWVFWVLLGHDLDLDVTKDMRKDFFDVLCGSYTIIGLGITIFQVSEIKGRQQDIDKEIARRKNLEDIIRIAEFNTTIHDIKTLISEDKVNEFSPKIVILKDELHRCKQVCPQQETKISTILQELKAVQFSINNAILNKGNPIDKESIMTTLDDSRELFGQILDFCKNKK